MLTSEVKSRPVYPGLEADLYADSNIAVCDRAGSAAVAEMLQKAGPEFAARTSVLLSAEDYDGFQSALDADVAALRSARVTIVPNIKGALTVLGENLFRARMSTRVYAAGSEPLIGSVVQRAMQFNIDHLSIRTEHRGTLKRRVQCVHCKGLIENVIATPVKCPHCGLVLAVRDHYSRRHAAFIGVCVDAEVAGEIPERVEFQ